MADRPCCRQCKYFHPPVRSKESGRCHYNSPSVTLTADEGWVTVPRGEVEPDDTACAEFEGIH